MVLDYLACAAPGSWARRELLPQLLRAERLGSTALASAMAHHVAGTPLPINARRDGNRLRLSGHVFWASNLFASGFVMITAVAGPDGARPLIVALPGDAPGLMVEPNPALLALQATGSSSLTLGDVPLEAEAIVTDDFSGFTAHPLDLPLPQSSCCLAGQPRARYVVAARRQRGLASTRPSCWRGDGWPGPLCARRRRSRSGGSAQTGRKPDWRLPR
jgi:alkylation response protein AidB-like acyl-CoA dehydrogenase